MQGKTSPDKTIIVSPYPRGNYNRQKAAQAMLNFFKAGNQKQVFDARKGYRVRALRTDQAAKKKTMKPFV